MEGILSASLRSTERRQISTLKNESNINTKPAYRSIFDVYDQATLELFLEDEERAIEVQNNTPALELFKNNKDVIAVYSNNEILSLNEPLDISASIRPLRRGDSNAVALVQDTMCLLVHAASTIAFPGLCLKHRYNIGNALYFQFDEVACSADDIERIGEEMDRLVEADFPIKRRLLSFADAAKHFDHCSQPQSVKMIRTLNKAQIDVAELSVPNDELYYCMWINPFLASTGVLRGCYELQPFREGMLAYYGIFEAPRVGFVRGSERLQTQLADIMDLHLRQAETIGLISAASINELAANPKRLQEIIAFAEFNHDRQIAEVAERATKHTKVIFVAGPSSSGKTTFANRLSCHLRSRNFKPVRVSLDDFYGPVSKAPRVPGTDQPDFEHLEALDLARIESCLQGLVRGDEVTLAAYDMKTQTPGDGKLLKLSSTGILIVEGIHALNDRITHFVSEESRLRIFIQPIGALAWDELRTIEHKDTRLLRRMCRDYLFRGRSADKTIGSWPSVRAGEEEWILPNQIKADVYFNSGIMYEEFVLSVYAVPLLRQVSHESENYPMAKRLLRVLEPMLPIQVQLVPENSLLCEFLPGGSEYEDFYF